MSTETDVPISPLSIEIEQRRQRRTLVLADLEPLAKRELLRDRARRLTTAGRVWRWLTRRTR